MLEKDFEAKFLGDLRIKFPGCIILKNDSFLMPGFPDRLILFGDRWAAFEFKKEDGSHIQPNQAYYIDLLNSMSYASFVFPENAERVLNELQQAFGIAGPARFFER